MMGGLKRGCPCPREVANEEIRVQEGPGGADILQASHLVPDRLLPRALPGLVQSPWRRLTSCTAKQLSVSWCFFFFPYLSPSPPVEICIWVYVEQTTSQLSRAGRGSVLLFLTEGKVFQVFGFFFAWGEGFLFAAGFARSSFTCLRWRRKRDHVPSFPQEVNATRI